VLVLGSEERRMPGKFAHPLRRGDVILHEQAGAGGHGDPFARDPEAVAADVRNEKITPAYARREHGVVIDAMGKVDADATAALRRERG
jgi:N-methylhydantoinase B